MRSKVVYTIVRVLTGLVFVVFGAMKFFPQFTAGAPVTGAAGAFLTGLTSAGYFIPFLAVMEVLIGLMLLFNKWSALASLMLVPISINIFLFDVVLMPDGWVVGIFPLLFNLYLLWYNGESYRSLFKK